MPIKHLRVNPVRGVNDLVGTINKITKGGTAYVFHPHHQQLFIQKLNLSLHFKSVDTCVKKSHAIIKLVESLSNKRMAVSRAN